jgi:hypothetical protein
MEEFAKLVIQVRSEDVAEAEKRLRELGLKSQLAERATDSLGDSWGKMKKIALGLAAAYGTVAAAIAPLRKIVEVQRAFDVLNASLITATGSADNANLAFEAIAEFAASTPYDIDQITNAFIKLVNYGLDPSEKALYSYGNTAAAMGKTLEQLVDAVASATTGEFEALKSFGIKARTQGDEISFVFRGIETRVENSAKAIEGYLLGLGQTEFAGAMQARIGTLDDTILALDEQWNQLWLDVARNGAGDAIAEQIQLAVDAVIWLRQDLADGALLARIESITSGFGGWAESLREASKEFGEFMDNSQKEGNETSKFLLNVFRQMPQNVLALLKLVTAAWTGIFLEAKAGFSLQLTLIKEFLALIVQASVDTGKVFWANLTDPMSAKDNMKAYFEKLGDSISKFGSKAQGGLNEYQRSVQGARAGAIEVMNSALDQWDATNKAQEAAWARAKALREQGDAARAAAAEEKELYTWLAEIYGLNMGDRLSGFGLGGDLKILSEQQRNKLERLQDGFDEEKKLERKMNEDLQLLADARAANEIKTDEELYAQQRALFDRFKVDLVKANEDKVERLTDTYNTDQKQLKETLDLKQISEETFQARSKENWANYVRQMATLGAAGQNAVGSNVFGSNDTSTTPASEQATAAIEEAFQARADKILELESGLNKAIAEGRMSQVEALQAQLLLEEDALAQSYDRRREAILANTKTTEEEKAALVANLNSKYLVRSRELETMRNQQTVNASESLFSSLADIAKASAGEQSGIYKTLFAASKAFAIADAIIKIQQGIAAAAATPWPANIAAMASVAAATASIVSNIQATTMTFAGAYEHGGMIPSGQYGLVGEAGPELVRGPAQVTSARRTAELGGGGGSSIPQNVNVVVHNYGTDSAEVVEKDTADGKQIEVIIGRVKNEIAGGIRSGGTPISRALEQSYGLRRGVA